MNEQWITVKEASLCLQITERHVVRLSVEHQTIISKYIKGKGRGGKQLRILLDSLPQEAQDRYNGIALKPAQDERYDIYRTLTDEQRKRLDEKVFAVTMYKNFKNQYHQKDCRKAFLKSFKEEYESIDVNEYSLKYWVSKYDTDGIGGLTDNRGRKNKGESSVTKEMQDMFLSYWLSDKKPKITTCYFFVKQNFSKRNIEVPHISSFKRFIKTIQPSAIALHREGKKYFDDNFTASIPTDYNSMGSNDEWIADHHIYDVIVNGNGKAGRAWLSVWMDRRTRYIVGYVINLCEPNADIVLDSFHNAVVKCGVPKRVHIDNGKDYKVHDLFNTDNGYSLAAEMKIAVRYALPYNAKAKSIERTFGTLETLNRMLSSYIGNSPDNRPESMKKLNSQLKDEVPSYERFKEYAKACIEIYNNTQHTGAGMNGRTPYTAYKEEFREPMRTIAPIELQSLMRRTTRKIKVNKNGVKFNEIYNQSYNSIELQSLAFGKYVYARYDTEDVRSINIYTEDGRFLCIASISGVYSYSDDRELNIQTIRENQRHNRKLREQARSIKPEISVPDCTDILIDYANGIESPDYSDIPKYVHLDVSKRYELSEIEGKRKKHNKALHKDNSSYDDTDRYFLALGNNKKEDAM